MSEKPESYITNSLIVGRGNEETAIFTQIDDRGAMIVKLDGYAIVPLEKYEEQLDNARQMLKEKKARDINEKTS